MCPYRQVEIMQVLSEGVTWYSTNLSLTPGVFEKTDTLLCFTDFNVWGRDGWLTHTHTHIHLHPSADSCFPVKQVWMTVSDWTWKWARCGRCTQLSLKRCPKHKRFWNMWSPRSPALLYSLSNVKWDSIPIWIRIVLVCGEELNMCNRTMTYH